jgi:hypothetical protein
MSLGSVLGLAGPIFLLILSRKYFECGVLVGVAAFAMLGAHLHASWTKRRLLRGTAQASSLAR